MGFILIFFELFGFILLFCGFPKKKQLFNNNRHISPFGGVSCHTRGAYNRRALAKARFLGPGVPTTLSIYPDLLCLVMRFVFRWTSDALSLALVSRHWAVCANKLTDMETRSVAIATELLNAFIVELATELGEQRTRKRKRMHVFKFVI